MDSNHFQKIQNTVRATGVLGAGEKSDWLDLMDLMNDRQLLELERILVSSEQLAVSSKQIAANDQQKSSSSFAKASTFAKATADKQQSAVSSQQSVYSGQQKSNQQVAFNKKITRPELPAGHLEQLTAPLSVPKPPVPRPLLPAWPADRNKNLPIAKEPGPAPSFKHILNFPKAVGLEAGKDLLAKSFPAKAESGKEAPALSADRQKKDSFFLTKLKAMFAEKELPAPPQFSPKNALAAGKKDVANANGVINSSKIEAGPAGRLEKLPPPLPKEAEVKKPPLPKISVPTPTAKVTQHTEPHKKHEPHHKPDHKAEKKDHKDNLTINLIVNSPDDLSKLPGIGRASKALGEMFEKSAEAAPPTPQKEILPSEKVRAEKPSAALEPRDKNYSQPVSLPDSPSSPRVEAGQGGLQIPPPASSSPAPAQTIILQAAPLPPRQIIQNFPAAQRAEAAPLPSATRLIVPDVIIQTGKVSIVPLVPTSAETPGLKDKEILSMAGKSPVSEEKVTPGLNFFEISTEGALENFSPIKPASSPTLEAKKSPKIGLVDKPGDDMQLETLDDVAVLEVSDLQKHASGTLFKKLQKLMEQSGQHEVVFSLEKSPLYKSYVNTGVLFLKNQGNFEKVLDTVAGQQMTREDFEHFADLLIVMRSKG